MTAATRRMRSGSCRAFDQFSNAYANVFRNVFIDILLLMTRSSSAAAICRVISYKKSLPFGFFSRQPLRLSGMQDIG
jgi:hypothetical protein